MAILDYSKDANKSIVIRFYNHEYGPEGQPLYYHTHENPAVIKGYVEFSTIKEIKASDIVLTFEARAESKWTEEQNGSYISYNYIDRLQQHSWPIPLKRANTTNQNIITPGVTRYDFSLQLDPDLPPSIEGRRGWFHYRFKALMQRDFPYRNMAVKHLIWVYSSSLRADQVHEPKVYRHVWNKVSSVTCTLPSNVFYQGQVVPLTIRIEPFLEKNVYQGQTLLVSSAIVKMKQYTVLRDPRGLKAKQKEKKDIFVLPVMEDWPATNEVYERIVEIELPGARKLAASIETVPVTKTHRLKLIMMVRTDDSNKKSTKELRVESVFDRQAF
ncbi:hypothetical protein FBU30_005619 [Linnemannia zychae]|nr:hypothetical protein FBU30_005619 [Linnemannia zychae]